MLTVASELTRIRWLCGGQPTSGEVPRARGEVGRSSSQPGIGAAAARAARSARAGRRRRARRGGRRISGAGSERVVQVLISHPIVGQSIALLYDCVLATAAVVHVLHWLRVHGWCGSYCGAPVNFTCI